jgi:DNA-binding HxlR family transcriptional regulator
LQNYFEECADVNGIPTGQQLKILSILEMLPNEMAAIDIMNRDPSLVEGTIYAALMRLEKKGYVTSRKEEVSTEPGAPRRYYTLTGLGARAQQAGEMVRGIDLSELVPVGGVGP